MGVKACSGVTHMPTSCWSYALKGNSKGIPSFIRGDGGQAGFSFHSKSILHYKQQWVLKIPQNVIVRSSCRFICLMKIYMWHYISLFPPALLVVCYGKGSQSFPRRSGQMDSGSYWPRWELFQVDRNDAWWLEAHRGSCDGKPHQPPTHSHSGVRSEGRFFLTRNPRTILSLEVHACAASWYSDWGYISDYSRFLEDRWLLI